MTYKFNPFTGNFDEAGSGGAPSGSDTQIQFNDSGSFAGSADLTWDDTAKELGVGGDINLDDGGTFTTTVQCVTPTANRTISFPDATGTVGLVGGSSGQLVWNNAGAYAGVSTLTTDSSGNITLSGRLTNSYSSIADNPAKRWTGTWFTGGTATTTKPHVLIEPSGTTSTGWSTAGTGFGVNAAAGFTGNLLDLQVGGTTALNVNNVGLIDVTDSGGFQFRTNRGLYWSGLLELRTNFGGILVNTQSTALPFSIGIASATPSVSIYPEALNVWAQRNGTDAQAFRLYNTFTGSDVGATGNYERGYLSWSSNVFRVGTEKGSGGGAARAMELQTDGITRVQISRDGVYRYAQPAPAAVNTTATLTIANIQSGLITTTTAAAVDMTLPTGTATEAGFAVNSDGLTFEWSVINTGSNAATIIANTDHTLVGAGAVAAGTTGRFATRRTAANTYVSYRIS